MIYTRIGDKNVAPEQARVILSACVDNNNTGCFRRRWGRVNFCHVNSSLGWRRLWRGRGWSDKTRNEWWSFPSVGRTILSIHQVNTHRVHLGVCVLLWLLCVNFFNCWLRPGAIVSIWKICHYWSYVPDVGKNNKNNMLYTIYRYVYIYIRKNRSLGQMFLEIQIL